MVESSSLVVIGADQDAVASGVSGVGGMAGSAQMSDEVVDVVGEGVGGMAGSAQMSAGGVVEIVIAVFAAVGVVVIRFFFLNRSRRSRRSWSMRSFRVCCGDGVGDGCVADVTDEGVAAVGGLVMFVVGVVAVVVAAPLP